MSDAFSIWQGTRIDFLRAELQTGLTFANLALSANY
jgi:hypothetical protein